MSRRLAALAAAPAIALLIAACGSGDPHGTVTEKEHEAAHTEWKTVPKTRQVCSTSSRRVGKRTSTSRSCKTVHVGTRRVAHHKAACWEIELDHDQDVCVSHAKYKATKVGDKW